ncbi:TORTIFOLIA1-like protein 2 isoform X1 [Dioscorea cayenensis subsp. rotundata]|uniref:TORTIFOLIA1-like protein 2 isoform X1 n=1 Tax=Dioscorea cayennensis subsp. rotundata TaxID=55577 RepID=A0AB40CE09_DIOCR|nr:TORTIFOLIA1-like protein 2 isoform X1 [Dioscorea cayenensis subsp. rotundata]XP_039137822.1 TORTIFOLIA1-like protein 2 isoform X1 [Dioscorea cayenensis subsp. rotundata]
MRSSHLTSKHKMGGRVMNSQQTIFELKHRVLFSLNKLADRDTHQIGVEELEKITESLTPEGIAPFLSCIVDTDAEQKSAVRKECVRIMGSLARIHGSLLTQHIGKMVGSIVKRLKDADSVVRDSCIETVGVLATNIRSPACADGNGVVFVALARPFFEALGEQNKYVQSGSALCLARVIDEASNPPLALLSQMLARVVKLLKNPHYMAKPAIIELIRSILQAGGATTEHALSAAVKGILETLKSSDWTTRKAASVALAGIALSTGSLLGPFKTSCLRSLECCRFDKVKPVRDAIIHAIQCWRTLPGADSPEPSEAGSSTKENFIGDFTDVGSVSDGVWRDASFRKVGSVLSGNSTALTKKRTPLTAREACGNYVPKQQKIKPDDWHIEITLPKTHNMPLANDHHKEPKRSCNADALVRIIDPKGHDDYDLADEKPECSSVSDLVNASFETKHVTVTNGCLEDVDSANMVRMNRRSAKEEIDPESIMMQERKSLDSTVTDFCSQTMHGCCLHTANELAFIKKQLLEIEAKQSNLLDLLKVFMGNSVDSLSALQFQVHNLENAIEKIAQGTTPSENYPSIASSKLTRNQSVSSSPRLSNCTPRPSVDINYRQPSLLSARNREMWGENACSNSRSRISTKEDVELWKDSSVDVVRNPIVKGTKKSSGRSAIFSGSGQARDSKDLLPTSARNVSSKLSNLECKASFWKRIKEFLCKGDVESAYAEVLCSGDDRGLIELMNRTGPVLERLSLEMADEILCTLIPHLVDQKFMVSLIPWLQQMVNMSAAREARRLVQPTKARIEFLVAFQEAVTVELTDPAYRISMAQLAAKLSQIWSEAACSYLCQRDHRQANT